MTEKSKNILITGLPGSGKTTLIKKLIESLADRELSGFYTAEIRTGSNRVGFELIDLSGFHRVLAHVDINSGFRVAKYQIDVAGFEEYLVSANLVEVKAGLIIIDEIGKMECLSPLFRKTIAGLLDSPKPLVATIARKGGGLIAEIKKRSDITLIELTSANRDRLPAEIAARL